MKAFDFFCGAGGLTRGLLDAGIDVIAGFDSDGRCRLTYEHNNPGVGFVCRDIAAISLQDLKELANARSLEDTLFAGCAPCQPFSAQRRGWEQSRSGTTLLGQFGRLVAAALPACVLVENVAGITRVPGFSTFRRFLRLLESKGYTYVWDTLDAKRYGVPQTRRRLVLIAHRYAKPCLPVPEFGPSLRPFRTVREAISGYPELRAGESHPETPNHVAACLEPRNLERLRHTPHDGGDRRTWPEHLTLECHRNRREAYTDVYGRMAWDAPAPTLTGRCRSLSNGRYGHPVQDRAISLREAAALQSFADSYVFYGSNTHIAIQIGNAVPVGFAEKLGRHIKSLRRDASAEGGVPACHQDDRRAPLNATVVKP